MLRNINCDQTIEKSIENQKNQASNAIDVDEISAEICSQLVKRIRAQGGCLGTKSRRKT